MLPGRITCEPELDMYHIQIKQILFIQIRLCLGQLLPLYGLHIFFLLTEYDYSKAKNKATVYACQHASLNHLFKLSNSIAKSYHTFLFKLSPFWQDARGGNPDVTPKRSSLIKKLRPLIKHCYLSSTHSGIRLSFHVQCRFRPCEKNNTLHY